MANADVTLKVNADMSQFRREVKRTTSWLRWRLIVPALVAGFAGGLLGALVVTHG